MRGPFCVGMPAGRTASMTSSGAAARTASQVGNVEVSRVNARRSFASVVAWDRIVVTSSATGGLRRRHGSGPYSPSSAATTARAWATLPGRGVIVTG